jgi:hypothetical protein
MIELLRATTFTRTQVALIERDVQRIEQQLSQSLANDFANAKLVLQDLVAVVNSRCTE